MNSAKRFVFFFFFNPISKLNFKCGKLSGKPSIALMDDFPHLSIHCLHGQVARLNEYDMTEEKRNEEQNINAI